MVGGFRTSGPISRRRVRESKYGALQAAAARGRSWRPTLPLAVFLLVVIATVSWRHKTYFTGGLDPVIVAKGVLSGIALALAWHARMRTRWPRPVGGRYLWILLVYLGVSVFGGWASGDPVPTIVLAVRLVILATIVILMLRSFHPEVIIRALLTAMLTVALVGALSGAPSVAGGGRLEGGLPPLNPNEIAMLLGPVVIGLCWLILTRQSRPFHAGLVVLLLGIIWVTGSRTAMMALVVAMVIMITQARQVKPLVAIAMALAVGGVMFLTLATNVLTDFFARGGDSNITTLSSRTIAWTAAFTFPSNEWIRWMGAGIATKRIPVQGQYWDDQLLDSSWVSALVQVGYLGVVLLIVWCASAVIASLRCARIARMYLLATLVLLIIRSTLESGLLDSTPAFVLFLTCSMLVDRTTRRGYVGDFMPRNQDKTIRVRGGYLVRRRDRVPPDRSRR